MLCRLRMGAGKAKAIGWMAETMAPLSVAAMGAKLLGLSEREMLDAVGVAYAMCSGNVQPTVEGAWSLWVPAGTAAAGGILAIDLARAGFVGPRNPLLGEFGLYQLYFRGEYDEAQLLGQLGDRNEILNSSLKPYPTCKYTHHATFTTLKLVEEHDLRPEQIKAGDRRDLDDGGHPVRVRRERGAQDGSADSRRGAVQLPVHRRHRHRQAAGVPGGLHGGRHPGPGAPGDRAEGHHADRSREGCLADAVPSRGRHDRDGGRPGLPRMRRVRQGPPQEPVHAERLHRPLHVLRPDGPPSRSGPASCRSSSGWSRPSRT